MNKNISQIGKSCVGCRSCEQVCPTKCIQMTADKEGFLYPTLDEDKCVQCGKCMEHCPTVKKKRKERPIAIYGVKSKNKNRILNSASGGASDLAAQYILGQKGSVFGCAYSEELKVQHIQITVLADLWKIQSSKYVQSDLSDCYTAAKKKLDEGKKVLFTGTPCQIAGLYSYIGDRNKENLYTIDLICHGVPSPLFFEKYLRYMEERLGERILSYDFRSKKKRGWGTQYMLKTQSKVLQNRLSLDKYGKHFFDGDCYRECCYQCRYACMERVGDITCGDFWGVEKRYPDFADGAGVSVVLVNSRQGERLIEAVRESADIIEVSAEDVVPYQGNLVRPTKRPKQRDVFYKDIEKSDFMKNIKRGIQLKERVKSILPQSMILMLKNKMK